MKNIVQRVESCLESFNNAADSLEGLAAAKNPDKNIQSIVSAVNISLRSVIELAENPPKEVLVQAGQLNVPKEAGEMLSINLRDLQAKLSQMEECAEGVLRENKENSDRSSAVEELAQLRDASPGLEARLERLINGPG